MPWRSTPGVSTWAPSIISAKLRPRPALMPAFSAGIGVDGASGPMSSSRNSGPNAATSAALSFWSGLEPLSTTTTS